MVVILVVTKGFLVMTHCDIAKLVMTYDQRVFGYGSNGFGYDPLCYYDRKWFGHDGTQGMCILTLFINLSAFITFYQFDLKSLPCSYISKQPLILY